MEQRLKERLFGAVIIISLFVIFLPMVLKEPQDSSFAHDNYQAKPQLNDIDASLQVPPDLASWAQSIDTKTLPPKQVKIVSEDWVVQLATFANPSNANKLVNKLKSEGYEAYLESVPGYADSLTWVMVGPVNSKEDAIESQIQLQTKYKMKGLVLSSKTKG